MEDRAITARNTLTMLAMTSVAFTGARALAVSERPPTMTRHQMMVKMIDCMRRQMSIDRVVSYNEAAKTCRDQISKQRDKSAPGALVASGNSTKP
jgi:hypothetical protein